MKKQSKTLQGKIVKHTKNQLEKIKNQSKTNLKKIDSMTDNEIDYTDIPELDEHFWATAEVVDHAKQPISLRVDTDVLDWFKHQKGRYQKLMNQVLRQYMIAHRHHKPAK